MYEYKFIKLMLFDSNEGGIFYPIVAPREDYYKIIEENANQGWRFVQIFAPVTSRARTTQLTMFYELIFEREIKQD